MSAVDASTPFTSVPAATFRRSPAVLACAAALCGVGLAACGVTLVRAADDAGILRIIQSDYLDRAARAVRLREPVRPEARAARQPGAGEQHRQIGATPEGLPAAAFASEPAARKPVERKARVAMASLGQSIASRRTLCVRVCDGYIFPLGTLAASRDLPAHQSACASACPGADTALYTLAPGQPAEEAGLARATADGSAYRRLSTAFLFRKERVPACSCQGPDNVARRLPILLDPTLRSGDVFVDKKGAARVYAGSGQVPHAPRAFADFRTSPALGRQAQAQVDRVMGTSQREARARSFERTLAFREAAIVPTRARGGFEPVARIREAHLREIAAPAGSAANVRVFSPTTESGRLHPSGARIIEIR